MTPGRPRRFVNFGRNVRFRCRSYYEPRSEDEVLEILRTCEGRAIRVVGQLHSWSRAPEGDDVVVSLRRLDRIHVSQSGQPSVEIGAGCTVERVVRRLRARGLMLPAVGMTGEQSLVGAISTGTHGSGAPSMSHFVTRARVAAFDRSGAPALIEISTGDALEAVRCALGRMGIILAVTMPCTPLPRVFERSEKHDSLAGLLSRSAAFPLTQFYLMPWSWSWIVQLRRPETGSRTFLPGRLRYRLLRRLTLMWLELCVGTTVRLLHRPSWIPWIYTHLLAAVPQNPVVDTMDRVVMMKGPARYLEMELFVPARHLQRAADFIRNLLSYLAGRTEALTPESLEIVEAGVGMDEARESRGKYIHHYPVTFRYLHRDDTLLSMSAGEAMYAISFVSITREHEPFERAARLLAVSMAGAFGARLHWGKLYPLDAAASVGSISRIERFATECAALDPERRFANEFTRRVLGF